MRSLARGAISLLFLLACSSSAPPPEAPKPPEKCVAPRPHVTIAGSAQVNAGADGRGLPVQVRLYQLKSEARLINAFFEEIWKDDAKTLEADLPDTLGAATRAADSVSGLADRTTQSMDEVDALIAELRQTAAVARELGEELSGSGVPGMDRALEAVNSAAQEIARLARSLARQPERLLRGRETTPGPGEE